MSDDEEILRMIADAASKQRPYAGFFDWPDRSVVEWGVATAFAEVAGAETSLEFRHVERRGKGNDPPDCEVVDSSGRRVALEVTELVDGASIQRAKAEASVSWAQWDREALLTRLQALLDRKDRVTLKDAPYDECIVLIHTAEPALAFDAVEEWLRAHRFTAPTQINRAYLLLSYDPQRKACPYVQLRWQDGA